MVLIYKQSGLLPQAASHILVDNYDRSVRHAQKMFEPYNHTHLALCEDPYRTFFSTHFRYKPKEGQIQQKHPSQPTDYSYFPLSFHHASSDRVKPIR